MSLYLLIYLNELMFSSTVHLTILLVNRVFDHNSYDFCNICVNQKI